ncbi:MAG: Ig-like domain-containing protein [Methanobrevibacter boviskoreani]|uniref:Ig-like domain-containing protein n=1 Tax=Methanobrevibacter boviskoreani TaxID=1348249 RepID=UPI0023A822DA|nr:Ig-like domain-containing protein [Methanobrevibacter boviskoreani]MCI6931349.1 Ig-like domain-containing protein [Methanobrevibacter boviskoreani]
MDEITKNNLPYRVSLHNNIYMYHYNYESDNESILIKLTANNLEKLKEKVLNLKLPMENIIQFNDKYKYNYNMINNDIVNVSFTADTLYEIKNKINEFKLVWYTVEEYNFLDKIMELEYPILWQYYLDKFPRFLNKYEDSNFSKVNRPIFYQLFSFRNACWIQSLNRDLNRPIKIWREQNKGFLYIYHVIVNLPYIKTVQYTRLDENDNILEQFQWDWDNPDKTSYFDSSMFADNEISFQYNSKTLIPTDKVIVAVCTFDEHYLIKGFPENDTVNYDFKSKLPIPNLYDHDLALDELGDILNVKRLKFKQPPEEGNLQEYYQKTYPQFEDSLTESDYWYEQRIRKYIEKYPNSNNQWSSLVPLEVWKYYQIPSQLYNKKRQLLHMICNKSDNYLSISIHSSVETVRNNDVVIFTGHVVDSNGKPVENVNVKLMELINNDWVQQDENFSNKNGYTQFKYKPSGIGKHQYRLTSSENNSGTLNVEVLPYLKNPTLSLSTNVSPTTIEENNNITWEEYVIKPYSGDSDIENRQLQITAKLTENSTAIRDAPLTLFVDGKEKETLKTDSNGEAVFKYSNHNPTKIILLQIKYFGGEEYGSCISNPLYVHIQSE